MKKLIATVLAVLLVAALAVPAMAAEFSLPLPPPGENGDLGFWVTDGTDGLESALTWDMLGKSTELVLEMPEPEQFLVVVGGSGSIGWWEQIEGMEEYWADGKLTINWSAIGINITDLAAANENDEYHAKVFLGSWGTPFADFGITKITLVYAGGGGGDGGNGGGAVITPNPKTGVESFLIVALLALLLSVSGVVLAGRKLRSK
ncbi:MAG: hypothetical protein FWG93_04265 [Oscillospiraceae bacterium]|nr:hypothetical protein [Oscillospiraceae bacterium]